MKKSTDERDRDEDGEGRMNRRKKLQRLIRRREGIDLCNHKIGY